MKLPSSLLLVCFFSTVAPCPTPLLPPPESYAATQSRPLPSRDVSYAKVRSTFGGIAQSIKVFTYPPYPHRRAALDTPPHDEADSHDLIKREAYQGFNKGSGQGLDQVGANLLGTWMRSKRDPYGANIEGVWGRHSKGDSFFDKRVEEEATAS